jgi:hypothetical protein
MNASIRSAFALSTLVLSAPLQAAILNFNFGNPSAAQYYSAQAYAELKGAGDQLLDSGGELRSNSVPVGTASTGGSLASGGTSMAWNTFSALDGFGLARTSASIAVTNANNNNLVAGYNAVASHGQRTQVQFFSQTVPGQVIFTFNVSGTEGTPYGTTLGRFDFLAKPYVPGSGSFFDVFLDPAATSWSGPGTYTYSYAGSIQAPLDLMFYAASGVLIGLQDPNGRGLPPAGASFSAFADYANTFDLAEIALLDENGDPIPEWTLVDLASGQEVFNQDGRLTPVPAPAAAWLMLGALAGLSRLGRRTAA